MANGNTKNMDIEDLFGKLSSFMDLEKRKTQPKASKDKNLALMVEKALEKLTLGTENSEEEEGDDFALITKTIKKFWKKQGGNPNGSKGIPPKIKRPRTFQHEGKKEKRVTSMAD